MRKTEGPQKPAQVLPRPGAGGAIFQEERLVWQEAPV